MPFVKLPTLEDEPSVRNEISKPDRNEAIEHQQSRMLKK